MQALIIAKEKLTSETHVRDGYRREGLDVTSFTRFTLHSAIEYGAATSGEDLTEAYERVRAELPGWADGQLHIYNARAGLGQIHKLLDRAIVNCFA